MNCLAELHKAKHEWDKAEPLYRRALAIGEATHGRNHPKPGDFVANLAGLFLEKNELREAEPLLRRALAIMAAAHGPRHPETQNAATGLCIVLKRKGGCKAEIAALEATHDI